MSDIMLYGVLKMPYELAMEGDISRIQFYQRVQEAVNRLERADAEIADLRAALAAKAVPDGWQIVPIKLTRRMKVASKEFAGLYRSEAARWNAILAAAPSPAEQEKP